MRHQAHFSPDFSGWRERARELLLAKTPPELVDWQPRGREQASLFVSHDLLPSANGEIRLPKEFLTLARLVSCIRSDEQWPILYRFAWRLAETGPKLLHLAIDPDLVLLKRWEKNIKRDIHKMHAFVRFQEREGMFEAWYQPDHRILREAAPFFARRFGDKPFAIYTPDESVRWNLKELVYGAGVRERPTSTDAFDNTWREYYRATFNPARVNPKLMQKEMPKRFWQGLPEASVIQSALREAPARLQAMARVPSYLAAPPITESLPELAQAASGCQSCPLHAQATQTVFGEGPAHAELMIIGEQPGDEEDKIGSPFQGPAGALLRRACIEAGVPINELYLTNAVKHFKWKPSDRPSKPRIHQTPSGSDVSACRPWVEQEIRLVQPRVILALGRTAGLAVLGRLPVLHKERGHLLTSTLGPQVCLSWHPAAILRAASEEEAEARLQELRADLRFAYEATTL